MIVGNGKIIGEIVYDRDAGFLTPDASLPIASITKLLKVNTSTILPINLGPGQIFSPDPQTL